MSFLWSCLAFLFLAGHVASEIQNKGWWKNIVFYQVYPRSFMDANGDGVGDLKGITSKLEHFVDSGVGGIWLSPIYASPMIDFGYDIADFCNVDEVYGSMADLEQLTQKAKKLGIKVVMDFVPNHTSDQHRWFKASANGNEKYKDYYIWRKGRSNNTEPPNNWRSVFTGSAWKYNPKLELWYFHQFEYRQPDLNYTNPNVRREMEDVLRFWLSKGIDGFRVDAVPYFYETDGLPDEPLSNIPGVSDQDHTYLNHIYTMDDQRNYDLLRSWRRVLDEWSDANNEDEKVVMTEAYTNLANTTKYYYYGVNMPFNFYLSTDVTASSKASAYKKAIDNWLAYTPPNEVPNWVIGNHDNSRIATRYPGRSDQMIMLVMTLPGVAVTYYGEEIGMVDKDDISWEATQDPQACITDREHYKALSRDPFRTPFQWDDTKNAGFSNASSTWLPVNDNYIQLNLVKQKSDSESHYKLYQTLTKLRTTSETLKKGNLITSVLNNEEVFAVIRQTSAESIVLLINLSDDKTETVNIASYLPEVVNGTILATTLGSGIKQGTTIDVSNISIPAKASMIFSARTK